MLLFSLSTQIFQIFSYNFHIFYPIIEVYSFKCWLRLYQNCGCLRLGKSELVVEIWLDKCVQVATKMIKVWPFWPHICRNYSRTVAWRHLKFALGHHLFRTCKLIYLSYTVIELWPKIWSQVEKIDFFHILVHISETLLDSIKPKAVLEWGGLILTQNKHKKNCVDMLQHCVIEKA